MSSRREMLALLLLPTAAVGQPVDPPVLGPEEEIALARSAAPDAVSADATVLVLEGGRYRVAIRGGSGVTCMVSRSQPLSLEPICYDAEASRTILPIEVATVEMRLGGSGPGEIDRKIEASIARGELAVPARPAMAYMMSPGQVLYADAETRVGQWMPHVHLYIPYATAAQFGVAAGVAIEGVGNVVDEGKPTANLVIRVREFTGSAAATAGP